MTAPTSPGPLHRAAAFIWFAVWMGSLALPVAELEGNPPEQVWGFYVLMSGWLGPLTGQFGWFANITFLVTIGRRFASVTGGRFDVVLALVSLACAGNALLWRAMYDDVGSTPIISFSAGFYAWQVAIVGSAVSAILSLPQATSDVLSEAG